MEVTKKALSLTALLLAALAAARAADVPQKTLPLPGEVFLVQGRTAFVILPPTKPADRPVPWVWYAPTLPNLPGDAEKWMFEHFTQAGIAIAGIDVGESYGSPDGRALYSTLYDELTKRRGFASKAVLLGRSRGGLMTLAWAVENADKVAGFAGIYPVCNVASYPGVAKASGAYRLTTEELTKHLSEHNPIDRLAALAQAGVPLFAIHGDKDTVVPLDANSGELRKCYEALGGQMQLIIPPGQGHNLWPGFFQCRELVDFVVARANVPHRIEELYAGFDPDKEPLDVNVVKESEQDGVVVRMLTYTVGTFKGVTSTMGAYYAFPKEPPGKLPAILQMHGGGQTALPETVIAWARNGYAVMAINWGGKPMKDQGPNDPGTDWGAVDATQTGHNSHYGSCLPDAKTLDPFESPRNSNWYLIVLAAKRAVSFLQHQPEVDPARIGATGHSMGGKLTVMLAGSDARLKAAAAACGGVGEAPDRLRARPGNAARPKHESRIYAETIDDLNYIKKITCPIVYLGPQNDFNGLIDELFMNWESIPSRQVAFAISKHLNHRHEQAASFVDALWFEQHLKGTLTLPRTPTISATLKGIPSVTVTPDRAAEVERVEIFYSIDPNGQFRFWRTAEARRVGEAWVAECPILSADMPLFCMANVHYPFPKPNLVGPPWNKSPGKGYLLSTKVLTFEAPDMRAASPKATDTAERMIEKDFDSLQDWYELEAGNPEHHQIVTRKIKDPKWRGPDGATLAIDVLDPRGGALAVSLEFNSYGHYGRDKVSGEYVAALPFQPSPDWQTLELTLADLKPVKAGQKLPDNWQTLCVLSIMGRIKTDGSTLGAGRFDAGRKLRALRWVGGTYPKTILLPGGGVTLDPTAYARQFQDQINKSIELEKRETQ